MRIARTYSFADTRVEETAGPTPGPGDIVVRVAACGLCSSDASEWYVEQKAPIVLGHEPVGEITAMGAGVSGLREGDRVFIHHHVPCGDCSECRRQLHTNCKMFRSSSLDPGGFAEFVRVPRENVQRDTFEVPASLSLDDATFIEPLACSLRAFAKTTVRPDDTVLIIGLGVMGLLNVQLARHLGAARILGSDLVASRRVTAESLGADLCFDPRALDLREVVAEVTDGRGADIIIVGPPSPGALDAAYACAAPGASMVMFAPFSPDDEWRLRPHDFYFKELRLLASYSCGPVETRQAASLLADSQVEVRSLVSHRFDLAGVGDAIQLTAAKGDSLKAIVYPHGQPTPTG